VPERPIEPDRLIRDVERVVCEREHCVIALSEGAVPDTGLMEVDAFGHRMKGGAADYVAGLIDDRLGLKVRMDRPNYLQRSFSLATSEVDVDEAYRVGRAAVRLAVSGKSDMMVTLERWTGEGYGCDTGSAPLVEIANAEKVMPDAYLVAEGNDVTPAFLDYARPLIGEPLPRLVRLERHPV
jgi:6-phosphofructokinase